jgi:hypothetical protein
MLRSLASKMGARVVGRGEIVNTFASQFISELGHDAPRPESTSQAGSNQLISFDT